MSDRLPSGIAVSALLRRANDTGGMAMVRAKGDPNAGAILLILQQKGDYIGMVEPGRTRDDVVVMMPTGPAKGASVEDIESYWQRRRSRDSDLWVVDLDIPSAERFAAETILGG